MPGRGTPYQDKYRYGFGGKEKDNEVSGNGNSYDYGARIYNPRLGRWLSLDPLQKEYPNLSPYNYVANSPIRLIDPDGEKIYVYYETGEKDDKGNAIIKQYEYGSGVKLPRDKFVRQTVRTLDKLQRKGYDPNGVIKTIKDDDKNHVAIQEQENWNASSMIIEVGQATIMDMDGKILDKKAFELPPDIISWSPNQGLISPDGKKRQSSAGGLLHELGHKFYQIKDPEGKVAEFLKAINEGKADEFEQKEKTEVGEYHSYSDRWIIKNVENSIKGWKRSDHSQGYFLKTKGGTFSTRGKTYGRWGKEGNVSDFKGGKPIQKP